MLLTNLSFDLSYFLVFCGAGCSSSELSRVGKEAEEIVVDAGRSDKEVGVLGECDRLKSVCEWCRD